MTRFANDCIKELHDVTSDLAHTLGEDTKALAMRVGLHSGATTAGVLRGSKGRFQVSSCLCLSTSAFLPLETHTLPSLSPPAFWGHRYV